MPEPEKPSLPPSVPARKPWPMKWVVFAILIYMLLQGLYLWLST